MAIALIILVVSVVIIITLWYMEFFRINRHLSKFRGPPPLPIFGNALSFGKVTEFIPTVTKFHSKYGGVIKIFIGFKPRLLITDHRMAEFLLGSTTILEKSYEYKFFHSWLGTGLLTSSSEKWKKQRRLITPTFHFQILEQFIDIFDSQGNILVKKLQNEVDGQPVNLMPYVTLCALDIICEAAMGTSVNAQGKSDSEYVRSVGETCRILMERSFTLRKMFDFTFRLCQDYQIQKKSLKILHGYTNSVIIKRREALLNSGGNTTTDDGTGIKKRLAFLDLLLQSTIDGEPLSNESIREEVDTFMFEGHDTTTSGISFTLYCLARHPEIQEKVVEELRSIFADDKDRPATHKDLQGMKYLDMVIKETLRVYPSVPIYGRELEEDVEFDGTIFPKGLTLTIFPYGLHRQPEVFPDPEKFDPERFSPENTAGRSPYAYLPFSAGSRNCIGQKFAMLEMKSTVSKLLRHFEIISVPGHEPILSTEAILKSANGLLVSLKKRDF